MSTNKSLTTAIIKRTLRVPTTFEKTNETSDSARNLSRQLDVALISAGFKASPQLLDYISLVPPVYGKELSESIIQGIRELVGDHVNHNTYFIDFPFNVPDTLEFWVDLVFKTYGPLSAHTWDGNLLELDGYGKYLHTYEEMLAAHEAFVDSPKDKVRVLHLGGTLQEEVHKLYISLAESKVPANGEDLELLKLLAEVCDNEEQPKNIPVRENKAIINSVRLEFGQSLLVDTVTDVLRLAAYLSDGDVSLQEKTKFKSFSRPVRKALVMALDGVIAENSAKLGDVYKHREQFKRLGEKLHVGEYKQFPDAQKVFETAREAENLSFESKVEKAFASGSNKSVLRLLEKNPGLFVRSFNRLLLNSSFGELPEVAKTLEKVLPSVSTPVIVSLRQYLSNRAEKKTNRVFMNRKGTGKVFKDEQPVLGVYIVEQLNSLLDAEVSRRLPDGVYVVDRDVLGVALPLSNKSTNSGLGIMPRGSIDTFDGEILRFFNYWKQKNSRTDYDLSAVLLNEDFTSAGQLSYTNLRLAGGVHSGDITKAPNGASEFIDVEIAKVNAKYIIPQVNNYAGEDFDTVEESFFGYMSRNAEQKGKPFEPKTVKTKAEMRGKNKVALPLVFIKEDDGTVTVKWLNAFLKGQFAANATENNSLNTSVMIRAIVENKYLNVGYLVDLLSKKENTIVIFEDEVELGVNEEIATDVTYIGREVPEGIPETAKTITLTNLHELL